MDGVELPLTTWGKPTQQVDVRALRRYGAILETLARIGRNLAFFLVAGACATYLWGLFTINFENLIFHDGTALSCIYDGSTGEIVNVR